MDWQPIEMFPPEDFPFKVSMDGDGRFYESALVFGPTWCGDGWFSINDSPRDGKGAWNGEPRFGIASTCTWEDFWTISSDGPSDYDVYILPTHWARLTSPAVQGQD